MEQSAAPVTISPVSHTSAAPGELVGFGTRLLAYLIDAIVLGVVGGSISGTIGESGNAASTIIGALYCILLWVNWNGQTLGKKAMGIKVVRVDGQPLDYGTAALRYVGYIISALPILLGFFWVIWDQKKQGFHDKIAKTYVVKA